MTDSQPRLFTHPDGAVYHVRVNLPSAQSGERIRSKVLTFEKPDGSWVGSISIYPHIRLPQLRDQDLIEGLHRALKIR
jgi:hypothetical protein